MLDDEICASAKRMLRGIELREGDFPARPHFEELLRDGHLLIAEHTQRWFSEDVRLPDRVIDRANRARHLEESRLPGTGLHDQPTDPERVHGLDPPRQCGPADPGERDDPFTTATRSSDHPPTW